jgi:hypothetical protein
LENEQVEFCPDQLWLAYLSSGMKNSILENHLLRLATDSSRGFWDKQVQWINRIILFIRWYLYRGWLLCETTSVWPQPYMYWWTKAYEIIESERWSVRYIVLLSSSWSHSWLQNFKNQRTKQEGLSTLVARSLSWSHSSQCHKSIAIPVRNVAIAA